MYVSRSNVNVRSETPFSKNSYRIVTSQLIYNANKLAVFHITKFPLKRASETDISQITQALQTCLECPENFQFPL